MTRRRSRHLVDLGSLPELARAHDALTAAAASRGGGVAILEGAAGTGKSALLDAIAERASNQLVLRAAGTRLRRDTPGAVARELLSRASPPPPQQQWAAEEILDALVAEAAGQPLMLVIDDLQWADVETVTMLAWLAERIGELPITLLSAWRPAEPGTPDELFDAIESAAATQLERLGPLAPSSVTVIAQASRAGADAALCDALVEGSGGNLAALDLLLRELPGTANAADVRAVRAPRLAERTIRQLRAHSGDAARATEIAAILDEPAPLWLIAQIGELDEACVAAAARDLQASGFLAREDHWTLTQGVLRRSIAGLASATERDAVHRAAADARRARGANAEAIAHHLAALRPSCSLDVAADLAAAAQSAAARGAAHAANEFLRRAFEETEQGPACTQLLAGLGVAEGAARIPRVIELLRQRRALEGPSADALGATTTLIELLWASGAVSEADHLLTDVAAAHPEAGPWPDDLAALLGLRAANAVGGRAARGRVAAGLDSMATSESWGGLALRATHAACDAQRGAPRAQVLPVVEELVADGRLLIEPSTSGWTSVQLCAALAAYDDHERLLSVCDALVAQATARGAECSRLMALGYRAQVHVRRGDLARAEAELAESLRVVLALDLTGIYAALAANLDDVLVERPSMDFAGVVLTTTTVDEGLWETRLGAAFSHLRGRLHAQRGANAQAAREFRRAAGIGRALEIAPSSLPWRSSLALSLPAAERDEAQQLVADELQVAEEHGVARAIGRALRARGALASDPAAAIADLTSSVALLERSDARYELAQSLVDLGVAHRRSGSSDAARGPLRSAFELAYWCGAVRLRDRAEAEYRAAGGRPRPSPSHGIDGLTPSELRAARLAVELTNLEIARELHLSPKTIETQLSSAYAKLGVSGSGARRKLTVLLEQADSARLAAPAPSISAA